jgi:ADP-heptose:LPS heptosyltransferase
LLLWPEQGFGDTILCTRFVAQARQRVGRIVLVCQPELVRLFSGIPGADLVIPYGQIPAYDLHAPLMSLPRLFAPDLGRIPPPAQLAVPEPSLKKFASLASGTHLKVGIVWSGSVTFKGNRLRATTLERFLRLASIPNVRLFSLQKGPRSAEIGSSGASALITDLAPHLEDFADTAAAIANLDLIVMTDSSVAHLAGSLGKPIWNLLPRMPYWLYGPEAGSTPWYPSMRLFRQKADGDWEAVFAEVEAALAELLAARQQPPRT